MDNVTQQVENQIRIQIIDQRFVFPQSSQNSLINFGRGEGVFRLKERFDYEFQDSSIEMISSRTRTVREFTFPKVSSQLRTALIRTYDLFIRRFFVSRLLVVQNLVIELLMILELFLIYKSGPLFI